MKDVGVTNVTNQSTHSFTSKLLSAVPLPQQSGAHLVSVLDISVPRSSTLHLNVSYTNNILIKFRNAITPKCMGEKDDIMKQDFCSTAYFVCSITIEFIRLSQHLHVWHRQSFTANWKRQ